MTTEVGTTAATATSEGTIPGDTTSPDPTTMDTTADTEPPVDSSSGDDTTESCTDGLAPVLIPTVDQWQEHGEMFTQGSPGQWDTYLWGGFGGSVVRKDGTFYLYYQGADGYDEIEETVTYRAIGVATSPDGLSFTKHPDNPVLTWFPNDQLEEGAVSVGAWLTDAGDVRLYYGANSFVGGSSINADGRVASSADGLVVQDLGVALDHTDGGLWGSGDELFPVAALEHEGTHVVYYIPNGAPRARMLGAAWGPMPDALTSSDAVTVGGAPVDAWGMSSQARLDDSTYAMFISDVQVRRISAYTMDPGSPASFDGPVQTYELADMSQGVVHLDRESGTWFLFHRNDDASAYHVRTADVVCR